MPVLPIGCGSAALDYAVTCAPCAHLVERNLFRCRLETEQVPFYVGSLTGNTNNRGFPRYVRRFHAAFLALPALPSEVVANAASDAEVVVRAIRTAKHGTYVAIVNTGFAAKPNVSVKLPAAGKVQDAVTREDLSAPGGTLTLTLDSAELRTLHVP